MNYGYTTNKVMVRTNKSSWHIEIAENNAEYFVAFYPEDEDIGCWIYHQGDYAQLPNNWTYG